MEVHDHKKTTSSEHENHGVHLCNKCGWPFPNPHPSAKHRRSHKRVCGTIEGYKLIDSESDHANLAVSDDEQLSDEDQRTPSPKVDKGSIKEPGNSAETGSKSHISEDELFSDAVTEFSDTGVSPSLEERLQSVKQLDKNVGEELLHDLDERRVSKDEKTADTTQPQHILTQLPQGPGKASEISDSDIVGSERKQSEITKSTSDIRSENVSVGVSSTIGLEFDSSRVVSESIAVSDNSTVYSEYGKQKELISSGLRTDIEEKEKGDEGVDVPSTVASEVLQSEHKLEVEPKLEEVEGKTLGPVALEAMALETEKETSDPRIEPEFQSKLNKVNGKTSRAGIVDEIVDQEKELTNESQSKHDVSFQIEHPKFEDALVVYEVESDSAKNLTCSSHGQLDEVCDLKEGGNEDTHLLSVAKALPAVENPVVMIGDFKDYKVLKSSFPLDLWAAEEIRSAEDDEKVTVPENLPSALSSVPAGIADNSSSDASKDDLKKGGASTSISGEVDTSVPENLPNALLRVSAGTVDNTSSGALKYDLKKEGVSTANDGEVGTSVPLSLPNALSSVPAATVDNSSLDALKDGLKREGVSIPIDGEVGTSVPEDLPSVLSGVPPGTVDNSSSDVFVEDHKKDSVSTPIDGEVGISVPDNLPNALSSVPTGIVESSSSDALKYDLKKEGVSTSIDGEVGTSVSQSLPSALSCVPAGTVDRSSSDALEDDLKKEGVSTPIDGEVGTSVPQDLLSALSSLPARTVDNSSSDVFGEDLKKDGVSRPIDGEVSISVPENLPNALSSVPTGTVDNFSSDALKDDLKRKGVSIPIDGEVGTSVPEDLSSALSSVPAGPVDNSSSDVFREDHRRESVSTPIDREVGTSVSQSLPSALSSVPAGLVDKSSSDALEDDLKKEGVSTPIDGEVGTSLPQDLLSALSIVPAGTLDNSSSDVFGEDLKKDGVSRPIDGEIGTSVPENLPDALSSIPTGTVDNSSLDALKDDLKREGVLIPIDGEVGTSVPEDVPSAISSVPAGPVDNSSSNAFGEDHKKQSVSTPIDGEVGTSVPENLPSALSSVPAGTVDNSSSVALKHDLKKEGVSKRIDGEVGTSVSQSLPSALSSVPAGTVDKSSSDALEDDLKKQGVSTPIDGDVVTSVSEDLPSALSSVPTGTVDNSSSDVFREDLKKESVSTPIDGEVGTSIPENLPSALSSVPAGTVDNSSSDALKYDLKKGDVSTLIDGKVGTSIPRSLPNALSSGPAGTVDNSSSDALEDDLKKEGVSTPMDGEGGTFVPEDLPSALSSVPARIVDKSCSDVFREDLKKDSISTPIDGEVGTSVPENLPSALSSVPTGTVDNTSSDALKYDLEKEGVSTPIDGEVGTSVSQSLPRALSSVPTGTLDNPSSDTLEYDLRKEGVSTRIDGEVGISVPEDLPSALSSVPAGTVDNSSSDALEDDLKKEGVSTPIDGEVGSSGFRVTSDEDTHLLSVADTLPAVENPDFMIGDFKDYKVLKSSFSFELGAAEEIRSVEADNKVTLTENLPSALSNVPAGSVDNSSSDALDDDLKKEGISIPIDGEVGASGFRGTNNGDMHLVSVAETSPAADNPEVMIGDFKDYKVLKSSLPVELGAAEEIRSAEDDKRVAVPENLPTALSNVPAGSLDNFSSDTLEDELKKEGVSIPIDGEIGATVFRGTSDADFGSSGSGDHPKATGFGANNQPNNNLEGSLPQSVDGKSLQNEDSEPTTREHFDVIPIGSSTGEQTWQTTNLYGGENAYNNGNNKLLSVPTENGNVQVGDELSENITTTVVHVEGVVENINNSISLAGDDSICHGNFRMGFSGITGNETVKVAAEEKLVKHTDATHESVQHLPNSDNLDEVSGSNSVHICARDWGKLYTSSESPKCSHNSCPNAFEGLKGDDTEVPRSSTAPGMVSELKYEDPTVPSEKTSENSSPKKTVALSMESELLNNSCASVEDMNARDATILGPLLEDGNAKVTKQNLSVSAVGNSVVSSSRAGSLEGNWGSVSVLSIQSDVTAVPGAEVPSSTDSQAAEKLDGDFKKSQVPATECLPDKSDVFEPPSFMTLVESVVGVDKNAAASEIQTAQRDEETKSEVLQAGWFPSLTNVVNESEGRKKNEEIIAKVTNWSTGKQHGPLKNLLSEAHAETKTKSPNTKQVPAVNPADETASKNNDTAVTNVSSILASESADTIKKEMEKEWNSPARYPIQIKKEKRKGKPYWVPFVCCTSVHQDF